MNHTINTIRILLCGGYGKNMHGVKITEYFAFLLYISIIYLWWKYWRFMDNKCKSLEHDDC